MKTVRVATVKATGNRYIVQQLSVGSDAASTKVHCWGEVVQYRTCRAATKQLAMKTSASTQHGPGVVFTMDQVTIAEVAKDGPLADALMNQARRSGRF